MPGLGGNQTFIPPPGWGDPHNWTLPAAPYFTTPPPVTGLDAWTYDSHLAEVASAVLVSGTVYLVRVPLPGTLLTINSIVAGVFNAGVTLTAGQCFAGVYDDQGNRIGVTADQSGVWTSAGLKTMALTAPVSGMWPFVQVAFVSNGTTNPTFARAAGGGAGSQIVILGAVGADMPCSTNVTGQTSLPATLAYASNSVTNAQTIWAGLS